MSSTTKNTLIVIIVIIIVVALFYAFRGSFSPSNSGNDLNATTTVTTTTGGTVGTVGSGGNGGSTGGSGTAALWFDNDATLGSVLASAAIRVPTTGVEVALTQGNADYTSGSVKGHVTIGRVLAKVPTNDGYDIFTDMVLTTPGSATMMHYVALFKVVGQGLNYTSAVMVGDRLNIQSVSPKADPSVKITEPQSYMNSQLGYILTINYLDRKNGEPVSATPTVQKSVEVHVKNHIVTK